MSSSSHSKTLDATRDEILAGPDKMLHPQSETVLTNLKKKNPIGYERIQVILQEKAKNMINTSTENDNISVIPSECGIKNIVCHQPKLIPGAKLVVKVYSVKSGSWFECFTGNDWRIDTAIIDGVVGDKSVALKENDTLLFDLRQLKNTVYVANVSISNRDNITFGPKKRAVSFAHLVGVHTNPKLMKNAFSGDMEQGFQIGTMAVNIAVNGICPIYGGDMAVVSSSNEEKEGGADELLGNLYTSYPELKDEFGDNVPQICGEYNDCLMFVLNDQKADDPNKRCAWVYNPTNWEKIIKIVADACRPSVLI